MVFSDISRWIVENASEEPNRVTEAECFFHSDGSAKTHLLLSASGGYAAFVNGRYVPSAQYPDYPFFKAVQSPDITGLVRKGENKLLVLYWYQGEDTSVSRREKPGLRFEVWQGDICLAASGESTRVRPAAGYKQGPLPVITPQLGTGFAILDRPGADWGKALCVERDFTEVPRPIPELIVSESPRARIVAQGVFIKGAGRHVGEEMRRAGLFYRPWSEIAEAAENESPGLPARLVSKDTGDGIWLILDLGMDIEGYPLLSMDCEERTRVDIGFGEHLDDMRVRTHIGSRCFAFTAEMPAGHGEMIYRFRRIGCRYLQVMIHGHTALLDACGVQPVSYPVCEDASMTLKDMLMHRISDVCRDTLRLCMHDHYEDCPWREQALYAFDSRNQMLAGYYAFGETAMPRESLRLLALSQRDDGLLELCAPARISITIPCFSLMWIVALEEYALYSGDLDFPRDMLPVAERILGAFAARMKNGTVGRFTGEQYWNFYEWTPMLDGEGKAYGPEADAPLLLFLLLALQRYRELCDMLGLPACVGERSADDLTAELRNGLDRFWDEEKHAYASFIAGGGKEQYAELTQALALYTRACPEERARALRDNLLRGTLVPLTLSASVFKYEVLLACPETADAAWKEIADRWGRMLFAGATTFWEVDTGAEAFARAGSLCHGWSAVPYYLIGAYGFGVRPVSPGVWRESGEKHPAASGRMVLNTPEGIKSFGCV